MFDAYMLGWMVGGCYHGYRLHGDDGDEGSTVVHTEVVVNPGARVFHCCHSPHGLRQVHVLVMSYMIYWMNAVVGCC